MAQWNNRCDFCGIPFPQDERPFIYNNLVLHHKCLPELQRCIQAVKEEADETSKTIPKHTC